MTSSSTSGLRGTCLRSSGCGPDVSTAPGQCSKDHRIYARTLCCHVLSARLQSATSRLDALQAEVRNSQLLLALVSNIRSVESDISAHRVVAQARVSLSAAKWLLLTCSNVPAFPPSSQHLRTRALEDLVADTQGADHRLRARTDAGPSCRVMPPLSRLNW